MAYDEIHFGTPGYTPGYNPNEGGSYERNYNNTLNAFTPDQLINRYKTGIGQDYTLPLDIAYNQAFQSFKSQIGREPTSSEFAQLLPAFSQGGTYGNALIGSMKDRLAQNPNDPMNKGKSAQFSDQINGVFKSMLGRDATADEASHFGNLLATGNVDNYQLQDFLRGTPEYQTQQDTQFRGGLSKELEDSDVSFFNRSKQGIISQFMQNGTGQSSALDSALTDLMGQISQKRGEYLANLSSAQYGGNKQLALSNYGNTQKQIQDSMNQNRQYATGQQNYFTNRGDEISDYNRQMADYMSMNSGSGGNSGMNAFGGAISGAGAGAPLGPWGAAGGAVAGGLYGYLNK